MTPPGQRVSLAAVRLSDVDLGLVHLLEESELARSTTFRSPTRRDAFTAGRIALRLHISALTGDSPKSLKADYFCPVCSNPTDPGHGIPRYQLPSSNARLRVSLSRSGNWCLLAASLNHGIAAIGVDIENGAAADFDGFASLAMTANERGLLQKAPPAMTAKLQTRLWVRKEAVLKALGTGLATAPSLIDVSALTPAGVRGPALWKVEDIGPASVGLPEDFVASIATRQRGDAQ
ncbi:4'-phosphopantetheinyl transferase superfamily protein [Pseudarthrobacter sp. R1]|uniref:4'-phosphopantetheinyl transferase family protein n=1 Tax=Pseudarthrobacter sp. R1 TaxID=2944934 RepID=UPI00210A58E3|nr:4'-phosphopantetheinyl transferase superfamily protein [Pseudarthrobacter sp. R1]MCQ6272911.1 4'-phosphopantetheinyl transferase superfamily protein [Pseudarthrobacter sp. R1]